MKIETPEQFFYKQAGYSYDAKKETKEQGRKRSARLLAEAERKGREIGLSFKWEQDDTTSQEFSDEKPYYQLWNCVAYDESGNVVASLSAIDFGRDGEPWGNPYRRVVEAELALEALE